MTHREPLRLPLQLAVVEGVAALQGSADGLLSSKRQSHELGGNVLFHYEVLLSSQIRIGAVHTGIRAHITILNYNTAAL